MTPAVEQIVSFFETLTPQSLARCGEIYAPDARFKDPFNDVRGLPAIQGIYQHMFTALHDPRFVVHERIVSGPQCFLTWDFEFRFKNYHPGVTQTVHGGSHLQLDAQGRITLHRDYWDAAEELYEKLPMVGGLMRWLKHRVGTG
ncbi:SnoaL-like domain-containing protein [Rhodoferax sp. OV413]|uniref:nuclear transport factor 2 family protein n=1 Tax=Rhodoferax sp. OV413 TaxID=1855285 RepID=UPI000892437C|nr:nuclear transport factor 2 family protein [Rhodoferax sp. OV413]SDO73762.1 SnoaL-like domain-containing protein [Rhodoferax sp. OV413]